MERIVISVRSHTMRYKSIGARVCVFASKIFHRAATNSPSVCVVVVAFYCTPLDRWDPISGDRVWYSLANIRVYSSVTI